MDQNASTYLGQEKIGKLLVRFSVPCIMSLLVSSLYNIVDQIFIGHGVGYLGNGATNVVFPITIITLALALMIGDGCAAFLSICQGRQDTDSAHRSAGNAVLLTVVLGVALTLGFILGRETILSAFGATAGNISYARDYFDIIVLGIPFYMLTSSLNSIIRADGSPKFAMFSTLAGCVINVILDPIAIFALGWGMKGAALATIAGQIVTAALAVGYLFRFKTFRLTRASFRPSFSLLRSFLPLGVSSLLTQLSIVIIMGVMNNVLVQYGAQSKYGADIPLTVVGIVMKVFQIVVSIAVGIAVGAQPIVGYNYGAGKFGRVKQVYRAVMKAECLLGVVAMFCFEVFPLQIASIFGSEDGLYSEFAVLSFRLFLCTILLCCLQKATSIFMQSLGKPARSMGLSLLREIVLIVPLALLLPRAFGVVGVLFAAPIADVAAMVVVVMMTVSVYRELSANEQAELAAQPLAEELPATF